MTVSRQRLMGVNQHLEIALRFEHELWSFLPEMHADVSAERKWQADYSGAKR
jgi:hypothetical protein